MPELHPPAAVSTVTATSRRATGDHVPSAALSGTPGIRGVGKKLAAAADACWGGVFR